MFVAPRIFIFIKIERYNKCLYNIFWYTNKCGHYNLINAHSFVLCLNFEVIQT